MDKGSRDLTVSGWSGRSWTAQPQSPCLRCAVWGTLWTLSELLQDAGYSNAASAATSALASAEYSAGAVEAVRTVRPRLSDE